MKVRTMRFFFAIAGAIALSCTNSLATAAIISSWPAAPNDPTLPANYENPAFGTNAADLARGPGIVLAMGGTFNSSGFTTTTTSFSQAVTDGDYLTFGFTTTAPVNLTDMDIRWDRSNTGPGNGQIELSANGGPYTAVYTGTVNAAGEDILGINLSAFDEVTNAQFRIPLYGASSANGTFDIETMNFANGGTNGIVIRGEFVPEPTTFALLGLSGVAVVGLIRRRK